MSRVAMRYSTVKQKREDLLAQDLPAASRAYQLNSMQIVIICAENTARFLEWNNLDTFRRMRMATASRKDEERSARFRPIRKAQ